MGLAKALDRRAAHDIVDALLVEDFAVLLGREEAGSVYFRNDGSKTQPKFVRDDSLALTFHHVATPAFADMDGDGDEDLFTGSLSGGITYWEHK